MGIFSNARDRLMEQMALSYLNGSLLAPYGRATSLQINSSDKTIRIEVELNGETTPVKAEITDYEFVNDGDRYFVTAKNVQTSREWLTTLVREQLSKGRIELPPQAGRMLMKAL